MKISFDPQSLRDLRKKFFERISYYHLANRHGRDLRITQDNLKKITKKDIILFSTLRNEALRIPFFLEYYRKIGVTHFIIIDNGSTDDFRNTVLSQNDVTLFYTEKSYRKSNFGMHWINFLLNKFGRNHWCIVCDPDEFLTYPRMEHFTLNDLTSYLDQCHRKSFFTLMIDMYGKNKLENTIYCPGDNPLSTAPYFDKLGYFSKEDHFMRSIWIQGGIRMRRYSTRDPFNAPALNKIPLVRWKRGYAYISSMHQAIPRILNEAYKTDLTGALLHFKFFSTFTSKVNEELRRREHYNNSLEYIKYSEDLEEFIPYNELISVEYKDWRQLEAMGLIKGGEWK